MTLEDVLETYCVECKTRTWMEDYDIEVNKSGTRIALGECAVCHSDVNRILPSKESK